MSAWELPETLVIGGTEYSIHTDFRDILDIITRLLDAEQDFPTRLYVALSLFYEGFEEMPDTLHEEAITEMFSFIRCGEEEEQGPPPAKTIDWEQDRAMIVSEVNRVAGCEVRALPFCHWWTFIAWFNAIGEGQLATVVSIREKLRKGKRLDKMEKEFYHRNRAKVDFKKKLTKDEQSFLASLIEKK